MAYTNGTLPSWQTKGRRQRKRLYLDSKSQLQPRTCNVWCIRVMPPTNWQSTPHTCVYLLHESDNSSYLNVYRCIKSHTSRWSMTMLHWNTYGTSKSTRVASLLPIPLDQNWATANSIVWPPTTGKAKLLAAGEENVTTLSHLIGLCKGQSCTLKKSQSSSL